MKTSGMATSGHCLCRNISYAFDRAPNWVAHCHCESCRRNCSAPFTTYFGVSDGQWRWTSAEPAVYISSPGTQRFFCPTCGTPMAYRNIRWPGEMHFYAASLANPGNLTPQQHVNWAEHLPWVHLSDHLPRS